MSSKCEAPDPNVDVLGAGDSGVTKMWGMFKQYGTIIAPIAIWSYLLPFLMTLIFGPKEMETIEKPVAGAIVEEGAPPQVELIEVEVAATWTEALVKLVLFCVMMFVGLLLTIYFSQEGLLYVPDQPIKFIEQNPPRYQSPTERGL